MEVTLSIQVIHVSGTQIIVPGTYVFPRELMTEGEMSG